MTQTIKPTNKQLAIVFLFDISPIHCLSWCEYFGYNEQAQMLQDFMTPAINLYEGDISKHLTCSLSNNGSDVTTVEFTYTGDIKNTKHVNSVIVRLLDNMQFNPPYNEDAIQQSNMCNRLGKEGADYLGYQPICDLFHAFNLIEYGVETYQERIEQIVRSAKKPLSKRDHS